MHRKDLDSVFAPGSKDYAEITSLPVKAANQRDNPQNILTAKPKVTSHFNFNPFTKNKTIVKAQTVVLTTAIIPLKITRKDNMPASSNKA